jgi:predicted hydrocarbon binding protein
MGITIFETEETAMKFAYEHANSLDLSYVPPEIRQDIIHDTLTSVYMDILLKEIGWASSDIRNEIGKIAGRYLLEYLEYQARSKGKEVEV